jgi:cellobiose phosphorylase
MAHLGDADALFLALRQANPVALRDTVPGAALRQRNCYYSSSDPAFADRYEGFEHYERVNRGEVATARRVASLLERRRHRAASWSANASSACVRASRRCS